MNTRSSKVIQFPIKGLDEGTAFERQPPGTCVDALNMRSYDPVTERMTGGVRSGVQKYVATQATGSNRIQDLNHAVLFRSVAPAGTSLSLRTIVPLVVSGGLVKKFTSSGFTAIAGSGTTGSEALTPAAPVIFSTRFYDDVFYVDGAKAVYFDADASSGAGEIKTWAATAGTFPTSGSNYPRLLCTWNGRLVLSGISTDPHNWFMSAVDNPFDFDYGPAVITEGCAVSGNSGDASFVADKINTLIPYTDDLLIFGCDHSIWRMTGDPMAGGRLDMISESIGMSWGRPWCMGPSGEIYFYGSRGGIFRMMPTSAGSGTAPERISALRIERRLRDVNLDTSLIRLVWNDREMGVNVYINSLVGDYEPHLFYDARADAWWADRFENAAIAPLAVHVLDGDGPSDRAVLLGSEDGYIRYMVPDSSQDDTTPITSYVFLGPVSDKNRLQIVVSEITGLFTEETASVPYDIFVGASAAQAMKSNSATLASILMSGGEEFLLTAEVAAYSGILEAPVSYSHNPRSSGYFAYVKLSNTQRWGLESLTLTIDTTNTRQRR